MSDKLPEITTEMRKEFAESYSKNIHKIADLLSELCLNEGNRPTTVLLASIEASCALITSIARGARDFEFLQDLSLMTMKDTCEKLKEEMEKKDG